jgi:hypothetical protein
MVKSAASLRQRLLLGVRDHYLGDLQMRTELTYREDGWKASDAAFRGRYTINGLEVDWKVVVSSKAGRVHTRLVRSNNIFHRGEPYKNMKAEQTAVVLCLMIRGTTRARSCCHH